MRRGVVKQMLQRAAVIVTGGLRYFSAGADLTEAINVQPDTAAEYFRGFHRLAETLEALQKPVLAAIEGFCFTGGLELALACDIRIGAEGSSYTITSARIGTVAGAGGTQRLPRAIGTARALRCYSQPSRSMPQKPIVSG